MNRNIQVRDACRRESLWLSVSPWPKLVPGSKAPTKEISVLDHVTYHQPISVRFGSSPMVPVVFLSSASVEGSSFIGESTNQKAGFCHVSTNQPIRSQCWRRGRRFWLAFFSGLVEPGPRDSHWLALLSMRSWSIITRSDLLLTWHCVFGGNILEPKRIKEYT